MTDPRDMQQKPVYSHSMTWNPESKTRFLSLVVDMLEQTCAQATSGNDRGAKNPDARWSHYRAVIADIRRGALPDTKAMQGLLAAAGSLTIRPYLSAAYTMGSASSDAFVRLYVNSHERPLEMAAPRELLRRHNLAPKRALLAHLPCAVGEIPEGDIILVEKAPVSLNRAPFVVLIGSYAVVQEVAAIAPYTLWSHDYGIYSKSKVHRLLEEDGITPLGRAVATFSGAPLPELDKADATEFSLIRDAWRKSRR